MLLLLFRQIGKELVVLPSLAHVDSAAQRHMCGVSLLGAGHSDGLQRPYRPGVELQEGMRIHKSI